MRRFLFIESTVLITLAGISGCGGGETGTDGVDIRKVIADPEAYAGQTLRSYGIIDPGWGYDCFRGVGAVGAEPLFLTMSQSLQEKVLRISNSVGRHQAVAIKYRVYEGATFAKIRTYLAVREQVEERSARKAALARRFALIQPEPEPEPLVEGWRVAPGPPVPIEPELPPGGEQAKVYAAKRLEAIAEIKRIEEIEATEDEPEVPLDSNGVLLNWLQDDFHRNYSGVLLDIWIP